MAAVNFPNNPSVNDTHTSSGSTWKWDGTVWQRLGVAGPQGAQGVQGANGTAGAQGAQGRQGAAGSNGAAGAQGAQGAQGVQGAAGAAGAQGATGAQGVVSDAIQNTKAGTNAGGNFSGSNAVGNTLYGWGAGQSLTTGDDNVYIGHNAGKADDVNSRNIGIGYSVLQANNGGGNNVMIGQEVAVNATNVQNSVCIGDRAGYWGTSDYAIIIGKSVGYSNPNDYTIAIGQHAGYSNAGEHCINIGQSAGYNSGGKYGINIGYNAGYLQSSNNKGNVAIGYDALRYENGNEYCVGIGNSCYLPIKGENTGASDNQLVIGVGHTAWIVGTKSYNIGLGVTNPQGKLHIKEGDSGLSAPGAHQDTVFIENSANAGITIATPNTNTGYLTFADPEDDNVGQIIYRHGGSSANSMGFFVNAAERLRIDSSGNVNFGAVKSVALPSGTGIQVYNSSAPRIKLVNDTTGNAAGDGFQLYLSGSGVIFDHKEDAEMRFYTDATEKLRITSGVVASFGNASPPAWADDSGYYNIQLGKTGFLRADTDTSNTFMTIGQNAYKDSGGWKYAVTAGASSIFQQGGAIVFETAASGTAGNALSLTEKLRITSSGNVTTCGTSTFDRSNAGVTARAGDSLNVTRSNGTPLEISRTTSDGNMINFFRGSNGVAQIGWTGSFLQFGTWSDTDVLKVGSTVDITKKLNVNFAVSGNDYVAYFKNQNANSYGVAIVEPSSVNNGYPLLSVTNSSGASHFRVDSGGLVYANSGCGVDKKAYFTRAWVNFDGTNSTIRDSGNVNSITDNDTGDFTINFQVSLPDNDYAVSGTATNWEGTNTDSYCQIGVYRNTNGTGSFRIKCIRTRFDQQPPQFKDSNEIMLVVTR